MEQARLLFFVLYLVFIGFPPSNLLWKKKLAEPRWTKLRRKNPTEPRLKNPAVLILPVESGLGATPQRARRLLEKCVHFGQGQEVLQPGAEASLKPKMSLPNYLSRSGFASRRKMTVAKAAAVDQKLDGA